MEKTTMSAWFLLFFIVLFALSIFGVVDVATAKTFDAWPTNGWQSTTPEEQGMKSSVLADMAQTIDDQGLNLHSMTIVRNGYLVLDNYFYPFPEGTMHNFRSCSQGVLATLVGIAIEKGYIKSVDQPILDFFPERKIAHLDEYKQSITIENLLTMTSGLDCQDGGRNKFKGMYAMWRSKDWAQHVLDLPMLDQPGKQFDYCSGAPYLLSAILQKASGMRSLDFARKYLFAPLGITDAFWETSPQGIDFGYDQLFLKPQDMAKIGWLYLNKGTWGDEPVVPGAWIEAASQGHVDIDSPLAGQFGYQWYVDEKYFWALGAYGQFIFVAPEKSIVAVFTGAVPMGRPFMQVKSLFERHILASATSGIPLENDPAGLDHLKNMTAAIKPKPAKKDVPPLPEISKFVSGRTYEFKPNRMRLKALTLKFPADSDQATLQLNIRGEIRRLAVGLDNELRFTQVDERIFAYKGTWDGDDTFTYTYRYVNDASFGEARIQFQGKQLEFNVHNQCSGIAYKAVGTLANH